MAIIRSFRREDAEALILLCKAHAEYEKSAYSENEQERKLSEAILAKEPLLYCLVVEQNGILIGYASYMLQYSTWDASHYVYMDCLFISEDYRSKGIGEKLVDEIKVSAKKLAATHVQWQTPEFNVRAIKFYNRIGATSKSKLRFYLNI